MIKKFVFPIIAVSVFWWVSLIFALGGIVGYFSTHFFHKRITKVKPSVHFNLWKWKVHFHHWIMGALVLLFFWPIGVLAITPQIIVGMTGGLIFHDLYSDKDWFRIFSKKQMGP